MLQRGQVFRLRTRGGDGEALWAYRYRVAGRRSRRVQRGGFASERDAAEALERALERLRREQRVSRSLTLAELVEEYLAQHDVQPVTIRKLRWLLGKSIAVFGDRRLGELCSQEIAAWRMTLSPGYRFEATQALRQVLARAVVWGMIDVNPAKVGVDNPPPSRPRWTRARDPASRHTQRRRGRAVDVGGRCVDVAIARRRPLRKRKQNLSRRKSEAL